ncbi:MAG: MBL fold metallo-hydrolase [Anaerolineales bacterium]|nr:MBL fold metallo-hydrolase [Anaerolineales bacterium]
MTKKIPATPHRKGEIVRLTVGPLQTNCYLAADIASGKAAVIDPGDETWRIEHSLAMHEWTLVWVLVTHGHFDHMAACGELAEKARCPIALHPADLPLWWIHGGAELFGLKIPDQPKPQHALKAGEKIPLGGLAFEVIPLPGHSPGGVGFYERQRGWLFSGDTLFAGGGVGRSDLLGGNEAELMESVRRILALPESVEILPGHGETTTVGGERKIWRELLEGKKRPSAGNRSI